MSIAPQCTSCCYIKASQLKGKSLSYSTIEWWDSHYGPCGPEKVALGVFGWGLKALLFFAVYPSIFLGLNIVSCYYGSHSLSVLPHTNIYVFLSQFCQLMTHVVLLFEWADGFLLAHILRKKLGVEWDTEDHLYWLWPQYIQHSIDNILLMRQHVLSVCYSILIISVVCWLLFMRSSCFRGMWTCELCFLLLQTEMGVSEVKVVFVFRAEPSGGPSP